MTRRLSAYGITLALILTAAALMRLLTFSFSLPYIDHPDEPSLYMEALAWRGRSAPVPILAGYPPAVLVLNSVEQTVLEPRGFAAADSVALNRFLSALTNLAGLLLIAATARRIAGDAAGLIAGAAWGLSPIVLEHGIYALADPYVYLLMALALWLAVVALIDPTRRYWAVLSFLAGLLAVLFKYSAVPALVPGGLVMVYLLARERRTGLRILGMQLLLTALVAGFLIFVYDVGRLNMPVTRQAEGGLLQNLLNPARFLENLVTVTTPINTAVFAVYALAGLVAYIIARRAGRPRVHEWAALLTLLTLLLFVWESSAFSTLSTVGRWRDILPGTPAACVLLGICVGQIAKAFPANTQRFASWLAALPLVALVFIPQLQADAALIASRQLPDRRVALRQWADASLDPGTVIVNRAHHKTFNPFYGGIPAQHWMDWWETANITEYSVDEWIERGMTYGLLDRADARTLAQTPEGEAFFAQTVHLKDFFAPAHIHGPQTVFFRLGAIQHPVDVRFGEAIRLVGYDLNTDQPAPGEPLDLRFYWQADQTPARNYSLFVHLTSEDAVEPLAQTDGAPARVERLTLSWDDPGETLISQSFQLVVPADLPTGDYQLRIGLYDFQTGERLAVGEGDAFIVPLTVE